MKPAVAATLLLLAFTPRVSQAQTAIIADAKTRSELETAREGVWRAWFAGDTLQLSRLIPAALAAGDPRGWEDRAKTMAGAREFAATGGKLVELKFDSTTISLRGRVAVVQARYSYVLQDKGGKRNTSRGFATEIFVRENGRWVNPFWYLE